MQRTGAKHGEVCDSKSQYIIGSGFASVIG